MINSVVLAGKFAGDADMKYYRLYVVVKVLAGKFAGEPLRYTAISCKVLTTRTLNSVSRLFNKKGR